MCSNLTRYITIIICTINIYYYIIKPAYVIKFLSGSLREWFETETIIFMPYIFIIISISINCNNNAVSTIKRITRAVWLIHLILFRNEINVKTLDESKRQSGAGYIKIRISNPGLITINKRV